jgi:hypothetical protein
MDRQVILDSLTSIETTAKLLVNALTMKTNEQTMDLSFNGIHQKELFIQTTTFLDQAQKLIVNLAQTCNLSLETFFSSRMMKGLISK